LQDKVRSREQIAELHEAAMRASLPRDIVFMGFDEGHMATLSRHDRLDAQLDRKETAKS
jgi:hypothetical protein